MVSKFIILTVFTVLISTAVALNTTQTSVTNSCPAERFLNAIIPLVCNGYPGENVVCAFMCREVGFEKGHCRMKDGKSECVCRDKVGRSLALVEAIAGKL